MELKTDAILKGPIWADTLERLVGTVFKTYWDVYALSISIGMMHDCQIESDDMVPEGYDAEPKSVPRTVLGHSQNKALLHGFIGKLADGTVATYQTLPWNHRGWHAGGSANDTHIGFEICEDGLADSTYFKKVYQEAVELCAYLCKQFGLTEKDIICHSEGYKRGIASNHGDVMHWFPKHGKSMDTFRAAVKELLEKDKPIEQQPEQEPPTSAGEITVGTVVQFNTGTISWTATPMLNWYTSMLTSASAAAAWIKDRSCWQ